jgi:methylated-DNA-protein-cysteine methyltransferase-like protein
VPSRQARPRPAALIFSRLLEVVRAIPRGRVATYGQVAAAAGLPRYARHVGYALHSLPEGTALPWHRVVGAGGAIRLRRVDGAWTQRLRLEQEGVAFTPRGRVRLPAFAWRPGRRSVSIGPHAPPIRPRSLSNARSRRAATREVGALRRRRQR